MSPAKKRILFAVMVAILLPTACVPASVATQDPALVQQEVKESVALTVAAIRAQATDTPTPIPATEEASGFNPVGNIGESAASETPISGPPTATADLEERAFETYCEPVLQTQVALGEITEINRLVSKLEVGKMAVVKQPVNLRTQPSLLNRIIVTLRPETKVEIIGGPKRSRFVDGTRYVWWKIKLPGGLTGWAVELSACRQYYFIELDN